ncbi:MAG: hypothetical protein ACOX8W_02240 [bacterium]
MEREKQIAAIVDFVGRYHESQASRVICRRALTDYDGGISGEMLLNLENKLRQAPDDEIASFHDLVR